MIIEAFLICDAATDQHGKLNVLGAFDSIRAAKFPCIHPACTIALRIRFFYEENGDHTIRICVLNEDGSEIIPTLQGNMHIATPVVEEWSVSNLILNLQHLKFDRPGDYSIALEVDGVEVSVVAIHVRGA